LLAARIKGFEEHSAPAADDETKKKTKKQKNPLFLEWSALTFQRLQQFLVPKTLELQRKDVNKVQQRNEGNVKN
jgi:hypothetical protein